MPNTDPGKILARQGKTENQYQEGKHKEHPTNIESLTRRRSIRSERKRLRTNLDNSRDLRCL